MTTLERFIEACHRPFDHQHDNCAHAVATALAPYPKASKALAIALPLAETQDVLLCAVRAATDTGSKGLLPAIASTGWGVAETPVGRAIVLRTGGAWWQRGKRGAVKVAARRVIKAWSAD